MGRTGLEQASECARELVDECGLFCALAYVQRVMTHLYEEGQVASPSEMKVCVYAYFKALNVDVDDSIDNIAIRWQDSTKAIGDNVCARIWRKALELCCADVVVTLSTASPQRKYKTVSFHMPQDEYDRLIESSLGGLSLSEWMRDAVRLKARSHEQSISA